MFCKEVSNQLSLRTTTKAENHMALRVAWQSSLKLEQTNGEDCHTSLLTDSQ
jgi:predicted metalloenzyme YecM